MCKSKVIKMIRSGFLSLISLGLFINSGLAQTTLSKTTLSTSLNLSQFAVPNTGYLRVVEKEEYDDCGNLEIEACIAANVGGGANKIGKLQGALSTFGCSMDRPNDPGYNKFKVAALPSGIYYPSTEPSSVVYVESPSVTCTTNPNVKIQNAIRIARTNDLATDAFAFGGGGKWLTDACLKNNCNVVWSTSTWVVVGTIDLP